MHEMQAPYEVVKPGTSKALILQKTSSCEKIKCMASQAAKTKQETTRKISRNISIENTLETKTWSQMSRLNG